jgi:hypothetical protein
MLLKNIKAIVLRVNFNEKTIFIDIVS